MLAFLASPVMRYVAVCVIFAAAVGGIYWKGKSDGTASVELRIERDKAKAVGEALRIERDTLPCVSDPECVLPDPFRMPDIRPDPRK